MEAPSIHQQLLDQISDGAMSVRYVLQGRDIADVQDIAVYNLLTAQRGWSRELVESLMRRVRIGGSRTVGRLTHEQRTRLLQALDDRSAGKDSSIAQLGVRSR